MQLFSAAVLFLKKCDKMTFVKNFLFFKHENSNVEERAE